MRGDYSKYKVRANPVLGAVAYLEYWGGNAKVCQMEGNTMLYIQQSGYYELVLEASIAPTGTYRVDKNGTALMQVTAPQPVANNNLQNVVGEHRQEKMVVGDVLEIVVPPGTFGLNMFNIRKM